MNTNDKNTRITLRLNEAQFFFIKQSAEVLGVSPSEFLRMMVNAALTTTPNLKDKLTQAKENTPCERVNNSQQ